MSTEAVERVELHPHSPWWGEHRSRYQFAASRVKGRSVIDIACGTGFGCSILADAGARLVIGVDKEIVARETASESVYFCSGDGTRIPLHDESVDVITSFETIEHIEDDLAFVTELHRVLKSDGSLILSTPNGLHSPKRGDKPANPFHIREYKPQALEEILRSSFSGVLLLGQRTKPYYRVSPYWETESASGDLLTRVRVVLWKLQNRMPFPLKDAISRFLHHRSFFPGEFDWDFSVDNVHDGHVLVALCRR